MFSMSDLRRRFHSRIEDPKIRATRDMFSTKVIVELLLSRGPMTRDDLGRILITYSTKQRAPYSDWESCRNHVTKLVSEGKANGSLSEDERGRVFLSYPSHMVTLTNPVYFGSVTALVVVDYVIYSAEPLTIFLLALAATALVFSTAMFEFLRVLKFKGRNGNGKSA